MARSSAAEAVKEHGEHAANTAKETVDEIRNRAQDYFERTSDKVKELEENLESVIQTHPVSSVLVAAAVGATVGLLAVALGRRS